MRMRFNLLVLAVTSLLVVAFVIPLSLLVARQAQERAQVAAEQRAQATAAALVVAIAGSDGRLDAAVAEQALISDVSIMLPDGAVVGRVDVPAAVGLAAAAGRPASELQEDGSWAVALPVATGAGTVAVVARTDPEEMSEGVGRATSLLALLAVGLIGGAVLLADRLGRSLVRPVSRLADVAGRLGEGDLSARAATDGGPGEIRSVARALNRLAGRLGEMIAGEREALADLSHRLRTPLTALRLEAERVDDPEERARIVTHVDRTQRAVDQLIVDVRSRGDEHQRPSSDLSDVVRRRVAFWSILAEDQDRSVDVSVVDHPVPVSASSAEVEAALDALIGNVFTHTPVATSFSVAVEETAQGPVLTVTDSGAGFDGRSIRRGTSGAGSTGLGLDIAASLARRLGGDLDIDEGPTGGALVRLRFGHASAAGLDPEASIPNLDP